ncbi:MAG TPA: hypothetical protein VGK87_15825, partial [Anaerolineae bacterium]
FVVGRSHTAASVRARLMRRVKLYPKRTHPYHLKLAIQMLLRRLQQPVNRQSFNAKSPKHQLKILMYRLLRYYQSRTVALLRIH